MVRTFSAATLALALSLAWSQAQEIVAVHHPHPAPVVAEGQSCGTCNDCVRITEIKKTQHAVYSCKTKEICVPNCNPFAFLFGGSASDCRKIEIRQLVKKYRTEEECHTKCATPEEAAKAK